MNLTQNIDRIENAKLSIKTAIESKGVTVPAETRIDGYPALIDTIPAGSECKLQEKTTAVNGIVTPDTGFDGLSKVTVDVPTEKTPINIEEKKIRLSESMFSEIPLGDFDFSTVTIGNHMFENCIHLLRLPENIGFSMLTSASYMFRHCISLSEIPSSVDFSKVRTADYMFSGCRSLTTLPETISFESLIDAEDMFVDCSSLVSFPETIDFGRPEIVCHMFVYCTSLTVAPKIDTGNARDFINMFQNCDKLETLPEYDARNAEESFGLPRCPEVKNMGGYLDLKASLNLSEQSKLTQVSIENIINKLGTAVPEISGGTPSLTLNKTAFEGKIPPELVKVATDKGWTITYEDPTV